MADSSNNLVTIPVAVVGGAIEVTYRSKAVGNGFDDINSETAKDYGQVVDLFCRLIQDWNLTEVLKTRFKGRVVETRCKVQLTRSRLLGEPVVPGQLLMHVLVAVVAHWSESQNTVCCAACAQVGAKAADEGETNG